MSFVRPELLPDEMAAGYMGRVMRINGFAKWAKTRQYFVGLQGYTRPGPPASQLLAEISGITPQGLMQRHTLQPLISNGFSFGRRLEGWVNVIDKTMKMGAFFCPDCIREDQEFHGFAYWRRSHQLPGAFNCEKHGTVLKKSSKYRCFRQPPSTLVGEDAASIERVAAFQDQPRIREFQLLVEYFVERTIPFSESEVKSLVAHRWSSLALAQGEAVVRPPRLSSLLESTFGDDWLSFILQRVRFRHWRTNIDDVLVPRRLYVPPLYYLLSISVLFRSADEAWSALCQWRLVGSLCSPQVLSGSPGERIIRAYAVTLGDTQLASAISGIRAHELKKKLGLWRLPQLEGESAVSAIYELQEVVKNESRLRRLCKCTGLSHTFIRSVFEWGLELPCFTAKNVTAPEPLLL